MLVFLILVTDCWLTSYLRAHWLQNIVHQMNKRRALMVTNTFSRRAGKIAFCLKISVKKKGEVFILLHASSRSNPIYICFILFSHLFMSFSGQQTCTLFFTCSPTTSATDWVQWKDSLIYEWTFLPWLLINTISPYEKSNILREWFLQVRHKIFDVWALSERYTVAGPPAKILHC